MILQKEELVLRNIASEVKIEDINGTKTRRMLKEMRTALNKEKDGVAIAAPQIGYSLRIFVVSDKIFSADADKNQKKLTYINPKIIKLSREKHWVNEGCLSTRPFYGKTYRAKNVTVSAYDENGKKFTTRASDLLAQIFQHEIDHLNGILFIDHAKEIKVIENVK